MKEVILEIGMQGRVSEITNNVGKLILKEFLKHNTKKKQQKSYLKTGLLSNTCVYDYVDICIYVHMCIFVGFVCMSACTCMFLFAGEYVYVHELHKHVSL